MRDLKHVLIAIRRLEMAQQEYEKSGGLVLQAKRIATAYDKLQKILEDFIHYCDEEHREEGIRFLFHIEDWQVQYNHSMNHAPRSVMDTIKLNLFNHSIPYPEEWVQKIQSEFDEPGWHNDTPSW
ncbi:hypothetical protein FUAX_51650 (plasmid) [Fulvitalea axinellae]|uniref:Uncharacterized protein n=1 Tax=Fulvitalea axinellae TaxID=1182444 RepID=A0AAU9CRF3_9BACT|nr:hypothetical protein FUAX_51650 [Fulvitalea axinellae]